MNLKEQLQTKLKELEEMKSKLAQLDDQKQKLTVAALELQGACRMLAEMINAENTPKKEVTPDVVEKK